MVDETIVTVDEVIRMLNKSGLESKEPENQEGAQVLGLKLERGIMGRLTF